MEGKRLPVSASFPKACSGLTYHKGKDSFRAYEPGIVNEIVLESQNIAWMYDKEDRRQYVKN